MPIVTIKDVAVYEAREGERLVRAIKDGGSDIGHRCGGYARCTTCRVRIIDGNPPVMTRAEYDKLQDRNLLGEVRLACQIVVEADIVVDPLMTVSAMGWSDPGPLPEETVTPEPEWMDFPV